MKPWMLYLAIAIALLVIGGFSWENIRPKEKPRVEVEVETLRVTEWATVTKWLTKTVNHFDTAYVPVPITDSSKCCETLDDCREQLWSVWNLEVEAEQQLPGGGLARVGFSMPLYREKPENAFSVYIERPDTNRTEYIDRYPERKWYHRIGISAGAGYGAGPLGVGPSVNVQVGYELFNLSDIWR